MSAKYVKPFLKGHKNDYRDAEAIAEAAQRAHYALCCNQNGGTARSSSAAPGAGKACERTHSECERNPRFLAGSRHCGS
jgi:hypothetical protein